MYSCTNRTWPYHPERGHIHQTSMVFFSPGQWLSHVKSRFFCLRKQTPGDVSNQRGCLNQSCYLSKKEMMNIKMDSGEWQIYLLLYRNELTTHDQPRGHMDPCEKFNGNKLTSHDTCWKSAMFFFSNLRLQSYNPANSQPYCCSSSYYYYYYSFSSSLLLSLFFRLLLLSLFPISVTRSPTHLRRPAFHIFQRHILQTFHSQHCLARIVAPGFPIGSSL